MNAKQMAAEIKRVGLLRAGNLQDELNALAIKLEDEVTDLRTYNSALQLSQGNIINGLGITGDGPESRRVIEYVMGLVAENAALKDSANFYRMGFKPTKGAFGIEYKPTEALLDDCGNNAMDALKTPATDAAIAEIKAQGVDEFASIIGAEAAGLSMSSKEYKAIKSTVFRAVNFAANLRAGRKG